MNITLVRKNNVIQSRLKEEMKRRDMSCAELAQRADVKTSFLYDVLSGKSANPSPVKLARIAQALGVNLLYILGNNDGPTPESDMHRLKTPSDYVTISRVLVEASAGSGAIISREHEGEAYYFRSSWVRDHLGVSPRDLRLLHIRGDSMEPVLCHNDMVLIDTTKTIPTPPGIFVLFDGFGLVAKRLEFIPGNPPSHVRIMSENPSYSDYERHIGETRIIGRIVWFSREI